MPSTKTIDLSFQMVNQLLIIEDSWNEQLIRSKFNEGIVETMLQTLIVQGTDKFVWVLERSRTYSIVAFQFFHPPIDTLPTHFKISRLWKSIWSLCAPPKVKLFVWKLIHNGVPVRQKLKSCFVNVDDKCPRCNDAVESIQHCFISCQHSLQSWIRAGFSTQNWIDGNRAFWQRRLDRVKEVRIEINGA